MKCRNWLITLFIFLSGCNENRTDSLIHTLKEEQMSVVAKENTWIIDSTYVDKYTESGWILTFQDEFDQPEISNILWNKVNSGFKDHGRLHHYLPEQVSIESGTLQLNVSNSAYKSYPYRSGAVTTQGIHEQLYGKFEIRAKFPKGQGLFPAIWLLPTDNKSFPEIDIVEMLGQLPNELWHVAHKQQGERAYKLTKGIDGSEWHVYTLDWSKEELVFYIDGSEQLRTPNISITSMYLWMNVAVGGIWVGDPNRQTIFPSSMKVDYVRFYSKEEL